MFVDGVKVGTSVEKHFFYLDLPAGAHTVSSPTDRGGLTFELEPGEVKYVRGFWVMKFNFVLIPAEEAEPDIADLDYGAGS